MAFYEIEYVEVSRVRFAVEADSYEEAEKRFNDWNCASDHVYDAINNTDRHESYCDVIDEYEDIDDVSIHIDEEDILTDEMYQAL